MATMTIKNTKAEILEVLDKVVKENKELRSICEVGNKDAEVAAKATIVTKAAEDVKNNIFSVEMNEKFTNLTEAIKIMEERLAELYGIEKELLSLTSIVNASKELQMQTKKHQEEVIADFEATKEKELAKIQEQVAQAITDYESLKECIADERKKEQEEYNYDLARQRKKEADEYADKIAIRAKADAEKTAALDAREKALTDQETEIQSMKDEIAGFDTKIKESYDKGYSEGEKVAGKEYGYKKSLADKEHEYELKARDNEIESLKKTVEEKTAKIISLEDKLDAAYVQINALATSTVEASGSIKLLNSPAGSGK